MLFGMLSSTKYRPGLPSPTKNQAPESADPTPVTTVSATSAG